MPYADYLPTIAPPWLGPEAGDDYWTQVGVVFDSVRTRAITAGKARFPSFAPTDALDAIGADRKLPRGAGETNADYAARLRAAWETWGGDDTPLTGVGGGAGTHLAMLRALALLGLPVGVDGVTIVQQNGWFSQLVDDLVVISPLMDCINRTDLSGAVNPRPGWTFEGRDNFYSEFGLLFPVDVPALTVGSQLALSLFDTVNKWRPAKALFIGTWVIEGITLGWPTGRTLGTDPVLGGNVIRYLPPAGGNRIGYYP